MKRHIREFIRRGLMAFGFGPLVLAILYLILHEHAVIETLTIRQVCVGIFSISALAFVAGGMNAIYQVERLPLMVAVLIHGGVLYFSYLGTYLLNDWLEWGFVPIMAFSVIFAAGYLVIWAVIYCIIRNRTQEINRVLKEKQQKESG